MNFLKPNESIEQTKPEQPGGSHDAYIWSQIQIIGADVGLPIVLTMLDATKGNMAAARAAIAMAGPNFRRWQDWLLTHFLAPVRRWWTARAIRAGVIPFHPEWELHKWTQNPPVILDPLVEIQAESLAIDKALRTRAEALERLDGTDLEEFYLERSAEIKREQELGIITMTTPGQKAMGGEPESDAARTDPAAKDEPNGP